MFRCKRCSVTSVCTRNLMSGGGRSVVGLDICEAVIQRARQRSSASAPDVAFVSADFFTWAPPECFHLIFDYTFFCALDPSLRLAWAARMDELLRPDGELITLMYLPQDQDSGPPYNTYDSARLRGGAEPPGFRHRVDRGQ